MDARKPLVALSGGPDSVALLRATVEFLIPSGRSACACWVDHALRPVSELLEEKAFIEDLCMKLGVPLHIETASRGEIEQLARTEGGMEAAARSFRYAALERARLVLSCDIILTGHSADDFVETMIMRFCTGSGIAGLRGIPAINGLVARPFLGVAKSEILSYLNDKQQDYRLDSTNATNEYLRNRVRHDIVPAMLAVFPSLGMALRTLAEKASFDDDALSALAASLSIVDGKVPESCKSLDTNAFDDASVAVRTRALYGLTGPESTRVPWRMVLKAALTDRKSGILASGAGLDFIRDAGLISAQRSDSSQRFLEQRSAYPRTDGFAVLATGPGDYRIGKTAICRVYFTRSPGGLRLDMFTWPVWIRSRRPGDGLKTAASTKMVDSLLSEMGVDRDRRDFIPILEDRQGIVALLASCAGLHDVYRIDCCPSDNPPDEYIVVEMKGAALTDATRR